MKSLLFSYLFVFVLACNQTPSRSEGAPEEAYINESAMVADQAKMAPARGIQASEAPEPITKKNIKTGGISFQSEDVSADYRKITALLPSYEAYIENENQSKSDQRISYDLTIRVPTQKFDSLVTAVSALAWRLDNKYANVQDVTERYYDLQTRIKNKQALEQRYLELLSRANELKDMLEIERQLNEVRTEIESLQGQFNYLSRQVSLSTLQLSFYEVLPYTYEDTQRRGFGARVLSALSNGWQGLQWFVLGMLTLWPFFVMAAGGILLFVSIRNRWRKRK